MATGVSAYCEDHERWGSQSRLHNTTTLDAPRNPAANSLSRRCLETAASDAAARKARSKSNCSLLFARAPQTTRLGSTRLARSKEAAPFDLLRVPQESIGRRAPFGLL